MKSLILVLVLLVGVAAGWLGGSWSGRHAREALAKVEATGQALEQEHKKQVADLNEKMSALTTSYASDKQKQDEAHAQQVKDMNALLSGAQGRVTTLEKARSDGMAKIQQLQAARAAATTPQAQKDLDAQIAAQQKSVAQDSVAIVSEQCLSTPVPALVLANWNGPQP